ncbi:MAG: N-acetyltransferase [Acidimicrobiaceae bacterium]|jgi:RimJ/RimL family protein N-acetyltransferase
MAQSPYCQRVVLDRQPTLVGQLVKLRPLQTPDFGALYAIASDPLMWEQHPSKDRTQQPVFRKWFDRALASGGALVATDHHGQTIGTSRFDHYDPEASEVEIGWTFLARSYWGGTYNGEVKRLMLSHAFGAVETVVFRVHSRNLRSQRAVEKLGAIRTGVEIDPDGRGENVIFRLSAPAG